MSFKADSHVGVRSKYAHKPLNGQQFQSHALDKTIQTHALVKRWIYACQMLKISNSAQRQTLRNAHRF